MRPGHTPRLNARNNLQGTPLGRKPYSRGLPLGNRPRARGRIGGFWRPGRGRFCYAPAMKRILPGLLLLLASCVGPPSKAKSEPLTTEVIAAVELMYDDLSSRRWDALQGNFLPDASLVFAMPAGPKRMMPPAFIEMVKKAVEGKDVFEERMTHAWGRTYGTLAVVWSTFAGREGNGEDIRMWTGVDAFTLVKIEGRWKISQVTVYQDPPEPKK